MHICSSNTDAFAWYNWQQYTNYRSICSNMKRVKLILYSAKSKNQLHDKDSTKTCMKNFQTEYIDVE